MKKLILLIVLGLMLGFAQAQTGLQGIIVEKYYISTAADAALSDGTLPVGSTTYRIYVKMHHGYNLQMVYGNASHNLFLKTTTGFFNCTDRGATTPTMTKAQDAANTNMLDSWLTMGTACVGNNGVLKSEDNGIATVVNSDGILQNNAPAMGIPLTLQDGLLTGTTSTITWVGINPATDLTMFDATSYAGNYFSTSNGAWSVLGGVTGPTSSNTVLIAQITTDGVFSFNLNVQLGDSIGGYEKYVASAPVSGEFYYAGLSGSYGKPNVPPTVHVTAPVTGSTYKTGSIVSVIATAKDSLATDSLPGSVSSVVFYDGATIIGTVGRTGLLVTDTASWTCGTVGVHAITAKATDNEGAHTTSSTIFVNVIPNKLPYVHISTDSASVNEGHTVNITGLANDTDGVINKIQFYINGILDTTDNIIGGMINVPVTDHHHWTPTAPGTYSLSARATDDNNGVGISNTISFVVRDTSSNAYKIDRAVGPCDDPLLLVPVEKIRTNLTNCIGFDLTMDYDNTKVVPSGNIYVGGVLIDSNLTSYSVHIFASSINISIYLNSYASIGTGWNGIGHVFSVEFNKLSGFSPNDSTQFTIPYLLESYRTGTVNKSGKVTPGYFVSYKDSLFVGELKYWEGNIPIKYDATNPNRYLITNIYGNLHPTTNAVNPDTNGVFNYDINNGTSITIKKDINDTTTVMPVINGYDAYLLQKVLVNYPGYIPNVYQIIAMDVNRDGQVSAGDLSQINERTVKTIGHFTQTTPTSQDWLFENIDTVLLSRHYKKSTTYPNDDNIGYSKFRVPQVDTIFALPIMGTICPEIGTGTYMGILLGDVNGNYYSTITNDMRLSADKVVFDLSGAVTSGTFVDVPVSVISLNSVNSLDFSSKLNNVSFVSVTDNTSTLNMMSNVTADNSLYFTSSSLTNYVESPISVRFNTSHGTISSADLSSINAYVNGDPAQVSYSLTGVNEISDDQFVNVYPNPAKDQINVIVSENSTIQLIDLSGKQILMTVNAIANQTKVLDVENLSDGIYLMKISNDKNTTMKKVVITR